MGNFTIDIVRKIRLWRVIEAKCPITETQSLQLSHLPELVNKKERLMPSYKVYKAAKSKHGFYIM